jgi:hypothetical protein
MKAFKVKYYHGHFIDLASGKRILPSQGKEYIIIAEEDAFKAQDEKLQKEIPKNSTDKAEWIAGKYQGKQATKLLDSGTKLFYRVGNSKRVDGEESLEYLFSCELLEDLYAYKKSKGKGDDVDDWRLCDCLCKIDKCLMGNLALSEYVVAPSLNWLFSLTVMFYFSMQRSSTCNAFTTFFLLPENGRATLGDAKTRAYRSLNDLRIELLNSKLKSNVV